MGVVDEGAEVGEEVDGEGEEVGLRTKTIQETPATVMPTQASTS